MKAELAFPDHFNYVSDWLCSLELTEYLSNFFDAGYKSMGIVMGAKITPEILEVINNLSLVVRNRALSLSEIINNQAWARLEDPVFSSTSY